MIRDKERRTRDLRRLCPNNNVIWTLGLSTYQERYICNPNLRCFQKVFKSLAGKYNDISVEYDIN